MEYDPICNLTSHVIWLFLADMPQPQDGEKFCGARINYRTKEPATCCADRSDDCTFIMSDGVSITSGLIPATSGLLPVNTDRFI